MAGASWPGQVPMALVHQPLSGESQAPFSWANRYCFSSSWVAPALSLPPDQLKTSAVRRYLCWASLAASPPPQSSEGPTLPVGAGALTIWLGGNARCSVGDTEAGCEYLGNQV